MLNDIMLSVVLLNDIIANVTTLIRNNNHIRGWLKALVENIRLGWESKSAGQTL